MSREPPACAPFPSRSLRTHSFFNLLPE
uniref:Uncharacterized protein n=1 Tax=Rhizophora mucronata TaxID=61149 RepID=A0A2P2NAE2_RHIMU